MLRQTLGKVLTGKGIYVSNVEHVVGKLEQFAANGPENLLVLTDFDHTMSTGRTGVKDRGLQVHEILDGAAISRPERQERVRRLFEDEKSKAYITAAGPNPVAIQNAKSELWYIYYKQAIKEGRFTRDDIETLMTGPGVVLRDKCLPALQVARNSGAAIVMISGGITDLIAVFLHQQGWELKGPNEALVSNHLEFDEEGLVCGVKEPIIHVWSKDGRQVPLSLRRPNTLLLGDSLGDLRMTEGLDTERCAIGFLNDHKLKKRDEYYAKYDIVLEGSGLAWTVPKKIIEILCDGKTE